VKNSDFKVVLSLITLILALAAFFGSYYLYKLYTIEKPIKEQLVLLESVDKVDMTKNDKQYQIEVKVNKVSNIQQEYRKIEKIIKSQLDSSQYSLVIKDNRDQQLQNVFTGIQPAVYEALAHNRYVWLKEELTRELTKQECNFNIFIDDHYLYLQIIQNDNYMYAVLNRTAQLSSTNTNGEA